MKDIIFLRQLLSIIGSLLDIKEFNYSSTLVHNSAIMIHYLADMSSIISPDCLIALLLRETSNNRHFQSENRKHSHAKNIH